MRKGEDKQKFKDDKIDPEQKNQIKVNSSPQKKMKLKLQIGDQNPSIQSQILNQHDEKVNHFVNANVISAKKQQQQQSIKNKLLTQNQKLYRFTINNRQSFLPMKEPNYFNKQKSFKSNNEKYYNLTNQDFLQSQKVLNQHLKNANCQGTDYVEIRIPSLGNFTPVYQIIDAALKNANGFIKQRKVSDDAIQNKSSWFKGKQNQQKNNYHSKFNRRKSNSVSNPINNHESSFQLTLGSKILLKHQKFTDFAQFSIKKCRKLPVIEGIYVNIYIKGKGYLICTQSTSFIESQQYQQDEINNEQIGLKQNQNQSFSLEYDDYQDGDKIQGIWRCTLSEIKNKKYENQHINDQVIKNNQDQQNQYIVNFMNLQSGMYLKVNESGFLELSKQKDYENNLKIKFIANNQYDQSYKFIVSTVSMNGSQMDFKNSKKYIPYEKSRSSHVNQTKGINNSQLSFELSLVDQSVATLQQQLQYIKSKLRHCPSLKLIDIVLETMLPYLIPEFLTNIGIVSEYIQKMFYDQKITHSINDFLVQWVQNNSQTPNENFDGNMDKINQEKQYENDGNYIYQTNKKHNNIEKQPYPTFARLKSQNSKATSKMYYEPNSEPFLFLKIIKYLNKLCKNSKQNSIIFFNLVDKMFQQPSRFYNEIITLVSENMFFIRQFYRRQWYQRLVMSMLNFQYNGQNQQYNQGYEQCFLIASAFCQTIPRSSIQNQFLMLHTISQPQFQSRNILLNLYVEGQYIFVRDKQKDMELMTFLESKTSNIMPNNRHSQQSVRQSMLSLAQYRGSKKFSLLQNSSTFLASLYKILFYLQTISMLTYGYNHTILKKYNPIIQKLLCYCNKQSPCVIKDYDFTRWVLKCVCSFYQFGGSLKIFPKFRLGIVDNPSGESKFKQRVFMNNFGLVSVMGNSKEANRNILRIDEKQCLDLCNYFLGKCKQYYTLVKSNKIKISQLFQTRAIYGQPIEQYFQFLKMIFSNRLLKFKEKKKAQFMQYIEKLFENVFPQNQKVEQGEESLILIFVKFLLRIISYDEKYENYLEKLKITTNYNENRLPNQLNINKKSTVKKIRILAEDGQCSKITKISLLNNFFNNQARKRLNQQIREADEVYNSHRNENGNVKPLMKSQTLNNIDHIYDKPNQHIYDKEQAMLDSNNVYINKNNKSLFKTFEQQQQALHKSKQTYRNTFLKNEPTEIYKNSTHANMNIPTFLTNRTQRGVPQTAKPLQQKYMQSPKSAQNIQTFEQKDVISEYEYQQKFLSIKRKALELIIVILQNINQEFIQESIQTLNYFTKNPTRLNLSSFQLFESIPKYEFEFSLRRRTIQQWYMTSQPETFQLLTSTLRMLHNKVSMHLNNISQVQIVTDQQLGELSSFISDNCREVEKLSLSMQSWFREQLYGQNVDLFGYFDEKLQNIVETISKYRHLTDCGCVSVPHQVRKLLVSANCFQWIKRLLSHISQQLNKLIALTKSSVNGHTDSHQAQQQSVHIPKARLNSIKSYHKAIQSYLQKITFILTFLTETISVQKLKLSNENSPIFYEQYESTLKHMQAVLCLLGKELSQIDSTRYIIIQIIQQARECYGVSLARYVTIEMWRQIVNCRWAVAKMVRMAIEMNDSEMVQVVGMGIDRVFVEMNKVKKFNTKEIMDKSSGISKALLDVILSLVYGPQYQGKNQSQYYSDNSNEILYTLTNNNHYQYYNAKNNINTRLDNKGNSNSNTAGKSKKSINNNNTQSFLHLMYRLIKLSQKHFLVENHNPNKSSMPPVCQIFLSSYLFVILQLQISMSTQGNPHPNITKLLSLRRQGHYLSTDFPLGKNTEKDSLRGKSHTISINNNSMHYVIKDQRQIKTLLQDIQKKKYILFMVNQYSQIHFKPHTKDIPLSTNNSFYLQTIRTYIFTEMINISIFQQMQKSLSAFHTAQKINTTLFYQLNSLMLQYLQYYCYDLLSVAFLLQPRDEFEIIAKNLNLVNDRLRSFLVDKSSNRIETYYSQSNILQFIKCFQGKTRPPKLKPPREHFQLANQQKYMDKNYVVSNIWFMNSKQVKKLQSTALKKWKKAIMTLQSSSMISETQFLYEIDHFSEIYAIKNKQELSTVINNQDLLKKLVSTVINMKRTIKSVDNKIFLLVQMNKLVQSKYFTHLVNVQQTRELLGQAILEQLSEDELYYANSGSEKEQQFYESNSNGNPGQQYQRNHNKNITNSTYVNNSKANNLSNSKNSNNKKPSKNNHNLLQRDAQSKSNDKVQLQPEKNQSEYQQSWSESTFVIILKLRLVKNLQYFANQYTLASLQIFIQLMRKALKLYFTDELKLDIAQEEFNETKSQMTMEPFYILMQILVNQIALESIGDKELEMILECLYECSVRRCWHTDKAWDYKYQEINNKKSSTKHANRFHQQRRLHMKLLEKMHRQTRTLSILKRISSKFELMANGQEGSEYYYWKLLQRMQVSLLSVRGYQQSGQINNLVMSSNSSNSGDRFPNILMLLGNKSDSMR